MTVFSLFRLRFFLDRDVPTEIARVLRIDGHEVVELRDVLNAGALDSEVLAYAQAQGLLLVTCNRDDFLALAAQHPNPGLIIPVRRRTRQAECAKLLKLLDRAGEAGVMGNVNFA